MITFTSPFTKGATSFQAEITIILLIFIVLFQACYDIMSFDSSAHFFYFLLRCLQKKKKKNQTVKIKHLKSKITFNKRSLYPMTNTKTNTHFLTKLLQPHQKFHVFFTVHIHPRAIHYILILHLLEHESQIW